MLFRVSHTIGTGKQPVEERFERDEFPWFHRFHAAIEAFWPVLLWGRPHPTCLSYSGCHSHRRHARFLCSVAELAFVVFECNGQLPGDDAEQQKMDIVTRKHRVSSAPGLAYSVPRSRPHHCP